MPRTYNQHLEAAPGGAAGSHPELRGFGYRKVADITTEGAGENGEIVTSGGVNYQYDATESEWRVMVARFGAENLTGADDFDDVTNARHGSGERLLTSTAANAPPPASAFWHPFSFEYNSVDGSGNLTQLAVPYSPANSQAAGLWMRGRLSGTWGDWTHIGNKPAAYPYYRDAAGAFNAQITSDITNGFLEVGDVIAISAHTEGSQYGGGFYEIVAGGTGTHDGYSYFTAGGLQVKALFGPVIDVMRFGYFDGTDIASVVSNAMTWATANGGGTFVCPPGAYRWDAQIDIPSNTYLGCPGSRTVLTSNGAAGPPLRVVANTDVEIENLTFTYDGAEAVTPNGVVVSFAASYVTLRGVRATDWNSNISVLGADIATRASYIKLIDCNVERAEGFGYTVDYADHVTFERSDASFCGLDGYKVRRNTTYLQIYGGHSFSNGQDPVFAGDGIDTFSGGNTLTLIGFKCTDNLGNGIVIKNGDVAAQGLTGDPEPRRTTIDSCITDNNTGSGITIHRFDGLGGDNAALTLGDTFIVSNCMADGNGSLGFYARARSGTYSACHATNNTLDGFHIAAESFDIDLIGCVAYGNDSGGAGASFLIDGTRINVMGGRAIGYPVDTTVKTPAELAAGTATARVGVYLRGPATECLVVGTHAEGHTLYDYHDNGTDNRWLQTSQGANYSLDVAARVAGTTAQRPNDAPTGWMTFDTTLNLPIWWDGTQWVDWVNNSGAVNGSFTGDGVATTFTVTHSLSTTHPSSVSLVNTTTGEYLDSSAFTVNNLTATTLDVVFSAAPPGTDTYDWKVAA